MKNLNKKQCLEIFGLSEDYTLEELEAAYNAQLRENDPSWLPAHADADDRRALATRYSDTVAAYSILRGEITENDRPGVTPVESDGNTADTADAAKKNDADDGKGMSTAKKAVAVGAGLVGAYAIGKAAGASGAGPIEGVAKAGGTVVRKASGCLFSLLVLGLVLAFVLPHAASMVSGGSSDDATDADAPYAYTDITVDDSAWYRNGSTVYVTVELTNGNADYSLVGATVTVDFYDADGNNFYTGKLDSGFLLPGQTGYAVEDFTIDTLREISRVDCYVSKGNTTWLTSTDGSLISEPLEATGTVSDHVATNILDGNDTDITVTVSNDNDRNYNNGYTAVVAFFDTGGHLVYAAEQTFADEVPANGTVEGTVSTVAPSGYDGYAFIQVYAYPVFNTQELNG